MPIDPVPVPKYPNVPYAPGVPAVARDGTFSQAFGNVALVAADVLNVVGLFSPKPWGIFDNSGQPAFDGDAVVGVELKRDANLPTYPIEQGAFANYNKVLLPFDARVTYTVGGSDARRGAFLAAVDAAYRGLDLYTVTMPEFFYASANIAHYDFARRGDKGVGLLTVTIWLQEIRVTASSQVTSTTTDENTGQGPVATPPSTADQILFPKQPSGASPTNVGPVQPADVTSQFGPTGSPHFFGSPSLDPFTPQTSNPLGGP